jgi:hypothetical protein
VANETNGSEEQLRPASEQETEADRREHYPGESHVDIGDDLHFHELIAREHERSRGRKAWSHGTNLVLTAGERTEPQVRTRFERYLFDVAIRVDQLERRADGKAEEGITRGEVDEEVA